MRRCAGLDIHKDTVVVCVLSPDGTQGRIVRKTFGTFRSDLIRLRVWLKLNRPGFAGGYFV